MKFELGNEGVEVKLGPWTLRRIRYDDIEDVREGYVWGLSEHWTNLWRWGFVTIRRKTGLIKNFLINPRDRETFISQLRGKIH